MNEPLQTSDRNAPWSLWRLMHPGITSEDWKEAARHALPMLEGVPAAGMGEDVAAMVEAILTERQFGPDHLRLGRSKRFYYSFIRPLLPASLRPMLRRLFLTPQREVALLRWPLEDRYIKFQFEMLRYLLESKGLTSVPYLSLWPQGYRFAFTLTHDIESSAGLGFVREVAALEEEYGFRSAFNFVPEGYRLDYDLIDELRDRGFEVGVHGLNHDGRLYNSRRIFEQRAARINQYLTRLDAVGFRSPFTHRQPEWMGALDVEYDSSFFDTDPFETIPGGTMSIWPFMIGNFVELPLTLAQDHTLISTLGERTPRLWLDKIAWISRYRGLAMMVTHPDYLRAPEFFRVYEELLRQMSVRSGYWHALPRDVARWWRQRTELPEITSQDDPALVFLPESATAMMKLCDRRMEPVGDDGALLLEPSLRSRGERDATDWPLSTHLLSLGLLLEALVTMV